MAKNASTTKPVTKAAKERAREQIAPLIEHIIRFTALANAGGAVATITVLGATSKSGDVANVLALPLLLFAAGVACALLLTLHTMYSIAEKFVKPTRKNTTFGWVRPWLKKYNDWWLLGGPVCFIAGSAVGVAIVAFA